MKATRAALVIGLFVAGLSMRQEDQLSGIEIGKVPPTILNDREFNPSPEASAYSFIVGGHLYGSPKNKESIYPSSSILANLPNLNDRKPAFFISLGDAVMRAIPNHFEALRFGFLSQLEAPFMNAVGNHDVANRKAYHRAFPGSTVFQFTHGRVLHIVIDTELELGRISGSQLTWLLNALDSAMYSPSIRSVVVYGHKLLWVTGSEKYDIVQKRLNNRDGYQDDRVFHDQVGPTLFELAKKKQVVWFGGDIGCSHSLPLFSQKEEGMNLTWVATGIGDTPDDALIEVEVSASGDLELDVLRLDGRPSAPLETFDSGYWIDYFKKKKKN